MIRLPTLLLFFLAVALMVGACSSSPKESRNTFEGAITARMFSTTQPVELKYAIKGQRIRVETQLAQGGTQTGVVLMDLSSGLQTMLMPQTKTYMMLDLNKDGRFKGMSDREAGNGDSFKATSTGKTETIAGHPCQHWLIGDKQETDACLANGLGTFGGGGQSGGIFDQLKSLGMSDKVKVLLKTNPEFAKFLEGGAFPLKISQLENGQSKTILEVTNIERKSLDDAVFAVPLDFKKMEIPGMPAANR